MESFSYLEIFNFWILLKNSFVHMVGWTLHNIRHRKINTKIIHKPFICEQKHLRAKCIWTTLKQELSPFLRSNLNQTFVLEVKSTASWNGEQSNLLCGIESDLVSHFNVRIYNPGNFSECRSWLSRFEVTPEILHFQQASRAYPYCCQWTTILRASCQFW